MRIRYCAKLIAAPLDPEVYRSQLEIPSCAIYADWHTMGPMPRAVRDQLAHFADAWATMGVNAWWEKYIPARQAFEAAIARLIGTEPGSVCWQMNATQGMTKTLLALDKYLRGQGKDIRAKEAVTTPLEFPSTYYMLESLGLPYAKVGSPDGIHFDPEEIARAINGETSFVIVSLVSYRSGAILDLAPIVEAGRKHYKLVILDMYQGVGTIPIDVKALGVDVAVGGTHKYPGGGPGGAFIYIRPDNIPYFEPPSGWMGRDWGGTVAGRDLPLAPDATRFLDGTWAAVGPYQALPGVELTLRMGVNGIRDYVLPLSRRLSELAVEAGFRLHSPARAEDRTGMLALEIAGATQLEKKLHEMGIIVDSRNLGDREILRLSSHAGSLPSDPEQLIAAILEARGS